MLELPVLPEGELLSPEERARVLSATRLKLTLTVFVVSVLLALSALMFAGVDRIFDWLTPSMRQDLSQKAQHGARELAQSAQLGMLTEDAAAVSAAVAEYASDDDVTGLGVITSEGRWLFRKQVRTPEDLSALLSRPAGSVHDLGAAYGSWIESEIEGAGVGKVAVLVSKARLTAGEQLRNEILWLAALGCFVALAASLVFVNLYIGPILRVTGESFERLARTTEAALATSRLKSEFLANMSHEIRTPMNGVIGVLDLLNRTALTPKQQRYTQTVESSARSLLTIINDILDFSKLEAGKYELRQDDFDVSDLLQDATELLAPKAHAKGLELVVRTAPEVPLRVRGDVDRLKQVIVNLLGNAIKFTERGHVQLHVTVDEARSDQLLVRFAVSDTGMGIRAEDQARLFGVFSQLDGSLTRQHGGTGLGLAICKRLAQAMDGDVGVQSEPGQGSTFWCTARLEYATKPGTTTDVHALREASVLVVSSSEVQRAALEELIERWGMTCEVATNHADACALLLQRAGAFAAAVVDSLPAPGAEEPNLCDLCVAEDVPVIRLLSTTELAADRTTACSTYLWKPVRASELYNSIVAILDGHTQELGQRAHAGEMAVEALSRGQGRVLVVDDNEVNRLVACELLTELGYQSDTAENGREAVDKVVAGDFHVVLMDCQMPGVDGFQATAMIRQLAGAKAEIPIIALTAHAMVDDRDRALRAGMDDYASKPIRARVLSNLLKQWVPANAKASPPPRAASADPGEPLDPTLPRSKRAVELFLKTVPELVHALSLAITARDAPQVNQLAHKLKGNCLSLGAGRLAAACHAVELAALEGRIDVDANAHIEPNLALVTPLLTRILTAEPSNDTL